ncbi:MAG: hypothetical protein ONB48_14305 [candidate division KSB1 bacterium]|nr:hypothetical protein [candidate division KSB1 bacterium]MDZ7273591.1 hypothetical protein [candidate division KSB1 bacterium]MDZ7286818.1 hypothetical protein [candidate division KSB1 bacterium]MDZ7299825.1 hypothetical protein [candidate division KSB1 bacterium]MDZ7308450.1 hypothetical protein [candidate division KSB1 bacterium]
MRIRSHNILKILPALLTPLALAAPAHSQSVNWDFTFGAIYPAHMAGGVYGGAWLGTSIDRTGVWQWDFAVGAGVHRRHYRDLAFVAGEAVTGVRPTAEIDFTRTMLPLMAGPVLKLSLLEMNLPNLPGLGWAAKTGMDKVTSLEDTGLLLRPVVCHTILWSREANANGTPSERRQYRAWGWGAEAGVYFTTDDGITSTLSLLYHDVRVTRKQGSVVTGLPQNRRVDLNGVAFLLTMGFGM